MNNMTKEINPNKLGGFLIALVSFFQFLGYIGYGTDTPFLCWGDCLRWHWGLIFIGLIFSIFGLVLIFIYKGELYEN